MDTLLWADWGSHLDDWGVSAVQVCYKASNIKAHSATNCNDGLLSSACHRECLLNSGLQSRIGAGREQPKYSAPCPRLIGSCL